MEIKLKTHLYAFAPIIAGIPGLLQDVHHCMLRNGTCHISWVSIAWNATGTKRRNVIYDWMCWLRTLAIKRVFDVWVGVHDMLKD
jgi:hypothetical protein